MTAFDAEILGRLASLTLEEIDAARADIRVEAEALRAQDAERPATEESVARFQTLLDAARKLGAQRERLGALATTAMEAFSELDQLTAAPEATPAEAPKDPASADPTPVEAAPAEPAETEKPADPPADRGAEGEPAGTDTEESAVTASTRRPLGGITDPPAATVVSLPKVTMRTTAAGGVKGFAPGSELDRASLAQAFANIGYSVSSGGSHGYERYPVATIRTEYPAERMLTKGATALQNIEKVDSVSRKARRTHALENAATRVTVSRGPAADDVLTAAGLCAPLETDYDIEVIGDVDRPVRDALVRMGAERGGIQWRPALDGVTQTGGIGVWTPANDEAEPLVPKTCVEIDCPGILTARVDAVYQCLTFSNMSTRFDPEWMDATVQAQAIAHARFSENRLLSQLTTASKNVYSTKVLGATRDSLVTLDRMTAYYKSVHRLNADAPLRWIAPLWYRNMLRADIVMQMTGDGLASLAVADEELARWLAVRNINVTWHLDGINPQDVDLVTDIVTPNQFYALLATNSAVPDFPSPVSTLLFREGDWMYLDGGTLDLGVVRDSNLNGQNRFQTFSESFETTAFRGIETIHLVMRVQPTGESAATADTTP